MHAPLLLRRCFSFILISDVKKGYILYHPYVWIAGLGWLCIMSMYRLYKLWLHANSWWKIFEQQHYQTKDMWRIFCLWETLELKVFDILYLINIYSININFIYQSYKRSSRLFFNTKFKWLLQTLFYYQRNSDPAWPAICDPQIMRDPSFYILRRKIH